MNKKTIDTILIGAALFAMFFGAGNLIFPPSLGIASGNKWFISLTGFVLTGIGLPVLGIISVAKSGGTINHLAGKVHPTFAKIIGAVIILAIGPLLAIPRTGATVYEIGIQPIFNNISPIAVSAIYFLITLIFVIKPSGIMDKIGKILTPILLLVITAIIAKGIYSPIGIPIKTAIELPFSAGFTSGYQTLDALGSIVMASIVLVTLLEKGYTEIKEQLHMTAIAGVISGIGLMIVYSGLLYLGACSSELYAVDISKTTLIINIATLVFGKFGQLSLCIVISAACLTTAVGLTAVVGNYFSELSNSKISYKAIVIATTLFSATMSIIGVEKIISLAVPLLVLVYPVVIVLIILGLFGDFISNKNIYRGAVLGAFIIGVFGSLNALNIQIDSINHIIRKLPLSSAGFAWIFPAILLGFLGIFVPIKKDKIQEQYD